MEIIQILVVLFALFAYSRVVLRARDKAITLNEFIFWFLIWGSVIAVALIPGISIGLANLVGITRGTDLAIYLGIIVLFYLVFRIYIVVDGLKKDLTELVQNIALEKKRKP